MKALFRFFILTLSILAMPYVLPGIYIKDFYTALIAAAVLSFLNMVLRPILLALAFPVNFITFGLFTFVINALLLLLASKAVPGFSVEGFMPALFGAILISVINMIVRAVIERKPSGKEDDEDDE